MKTYKLLHRYGKNQMHEGQIGNDYQSLELAIIAAIAAAKEAEKTLGIFEQKAKELALNKATEDLDQEQYIDWMWDNYRLELELVKLDDDADVLEFEDEDFLNIPSELKEEFSEYFCCLGGWSQSSKSYFYIPSF